MVKGNRSKDQGRSSFKTNKGYLSKLHVKNQIEEQISVSNCTALHHFFS